MSIQPIDLQVLFSRLNEIGRDQAAHRDSQLQAQAVVGSEIAERSEQRDHRVNELSTEEEGPAVVGDEAEGRRGDNRHKSADEDAGPTDHSVFRDPDLGQHVDVTG